MFCNLLLMAVIDGLLNYKELGTDNPFQEDTKKIKALNQLCKKDIIEFLNEIDPSFINKVLSKNDVIDYILEQGKGKRIKQWILNRR